MKITKLVHSCVLVEDGERVALFDPGAMSAEMVRDLTLTQLDDIFITHEHFDHTDIELIKELVDDFPEARITGNPSVVSLLAQSGISATDEAPEGVEYFDSPHEKVEPLFPTPEQKGIHYLEAFSHPGDSHHFEETMPILALPITAPWGATVTAVNLGIKLKPKYVLPIHDWHWSDEARKMMYEGLEKAFADEGIIFIKAVNGEPFECDV